MKAGFQPGMMQAQDLNFFPRSLWPCFSIKLKKAALSKQPLLRKGKKDEKTIF
jgi:hypothetical protein